MKHFGAIACAMTVAACSSGERIEFVRKDPPNLVDPTKEDAGAPTDCVEAYAETTRAVDIIMSIDQSASMLEEIDALTTSINSLPPLLGASGLDYRVVMVADVGRMPLEVCIPEPLGGPNCSSNGTIFRAVDQHIESTDMLALLLRTLDYPTPRLAWRDFLRPGVLKVIVPITDDDTIDESATDFDVELRRRGDPLFGTAESRNYMVFPIIGTNDYPDTTPCATAARPGLEYQRLARLTNGRWFSVCRPSFGSIVEDIGRVVMDTVSCEVAVPAPPAGSSLDSAKINVRITPTNGEPVVIPQDASHPCTDGANGWQFSGDKSKILLCGGACDAVKRDASTKFSVGFGCTTTTR